MYVDIDRTDMKKVVVGGAASATAFVTSATDVRTVKLEEDDESSKS